MPLNWVTADGCGNVQLETGQEFGSMMPSSSCIVAQSQVDQGIPFDEF
jgi:hypothetical protein